MSPPSTQIENEELHQLVREVKRVTRLLESMKDDIQKNKHHLLLLVGLITNRMMAFSHVAEEYGKLFQLNSRHFGFNLRLLKESCDDINRFFWDELDKFQQKFCSEPHFFKSINWHVARTQLNPILQAVFHTLSGMTGVIDTIRREMNSHTLKDEPSKYHLRVELLKCIDVLKDLVILGKNKYLPMPDVQQILSLIQPTKSITTIPSSSPTLVAS